MQQFKNLLFITSARATDEAALQRVANLARNWRAELTVVAVVESLPRAMRQIMLRFRHVDRQELAVREAQERLDRIIAPIRRKGLRVNRKVLCGSPSVETIREVLRNRHDLVVTTHETRRGLRGFVLGSTSLRLLRECPCPVWVMKPSERKPYARVLAAVDPEPGDATRNSLNEEILRLATSWAGSEKSELHVVHAWQLFGEESLRSGRIRMPRSEVDKLVRLERDRHRRGLKRLLLPFALEPANHHVHLVKGIPAEAIGRLAERTQAELIVMGTVCRTGITGFLIGNTAETVLRDVRCSVLAVKPKGFVTPVKL